MKPRESAPPPASGSSLLQLVSEHAITNLLPVMALRPARLVLVRHADSKLEAAVAHLRAVIPVLAQNPAFKGYQPKIGELVLNSTSPEIAEARDLIARELVASPGMVVNFTGGTKQMSIGAHLAASVFGRASFACDPAADRLADAHTGRHERWPDIETLTKHFSVRLLLAVQGRSLDEFRSETATDAMRAFGLKAFELRNQNGQALDVLNKALRTHFYTSNGRLPQEPEELKTLLARPFMVLGDPVRFYLTAAATAGLVRSEAQGWRLLAQPERRSIERVLHLINNGWLELAVMDCLLRNPRYQDSLWSVEPVRLNNGDPADADILCLDTRTVSLRLISCKVVLTRSPAEQLEIIADRARRLGGAACTLVVLKPTQGQESLLRSEARRLGIDLAIEADEIVKAFAPHVK
jgi:hypothetical protein